MRHTTHHALSSGGTIVPDLNCAIPADKERCLSLQGQVLVERDGFYVMAVFCVLTGLIVLLILKERLLPLQDLPESAWSLKSLHSPTARWPSQADSRDSVV